MERGLRIISYGIIGALIGGMIIRETGVIVGGIIGIIIAGSSD